MRDNVQIKERAQGRWYQILRGLGVEDSFLNKRNGPCPLCGGGTDRFRWKDTDGHGGYYCNKCGPGDGFDLLMKLHPWKFRETACRIEEYLGDGASNYKPKPKNDPAVAIKRVMGEAQAITQGDEVSRYLEGRGLYGIPSDLLFHAALYESETSKTFPAMIALVKNVEGVVVSVHRTYLQAGEKAKINSPRKMMTPVGTVNGATIRLYPVESHIGIAEGIETCIAAHQLFNIPVWAAISAGGVKTFKPPEGVNRVTVYSDNDRNFVGQSAGYELAKKLSLKGVQVEVKVPFHAGDDWADVLLQKEQVDHG